MTFCGPHRRVVPITVGGAPTTPQSSQKGRIPEDNQGTPLFADSGSSPHYIKCSRSDSSDDGDMTSEKVAARPNNSGEARRA